MLRFEEIKKLKLCSYKTFFCVKEIVKMGVAFLFGSNEKVLK